MSSSKELSVGLCILVWNELPGCKMDIPKIDLSQFDQVFAVDGGSNDGTVQYLEEAGIQVKKQPVKGYNAAYIFAFEQCECDALLFYHPKGTVPIEHLYYFRPLLNQGHDLVIASRLEKKSRNEEDDKIFKYRKWLVMALALFCSIIWKKRDQKIAWDVLHGFRAMKVSSFKAINPLKEGLSIDLEMVIRCYKENFSIIEFPTQESHCIYRDTHFKTWPTGVKILKYLKKEIFRKD